MQKRSLGTKGLHISQVTGTFILIFSFTKEDSGNQLDCIVEPVHGQPVTITNNIIVECMYVHIMGVFPLRLLG